MIRLSSTAVCENRMAMYLNHSKGGKITSATSSSKRLIGIFIKNRFWFYNFNKLVM